MSDIERRLAALSPAKQELLRVRLYRRDQEMRQSRSILRRTSGDELSLSFSQERIWLHEQLAPQSIAFNRPANIVLRGPLQIEPLRQALGKVIARHESLRTTITLTAGTPSLCIHPHVSVEMPLTDLSGAATPERRARQMAQEEACRPFDLEQGPLVRSHLLRIDHEHHLFLLTFHHFVFDAWSQAVLLEELTQNYAEYSAGVDLQVDPPAIHYTDFAVWDRCQQRVAALEASRAYWQGQLANPPVLRLPTDFPYPPKPSEEAGYVDIDLPGELVDLLREFARCERTTLFSVLLAAFTTLLHRYTDDDDIVVGYPVAGRNRVETEQLIGVFINMILFRTNLVVVDSFRQLLQRVRDCVIRGLRHQDVPLQFVVQDVLTDRDVRRPPLFQVMLNYESLPSPPREAASVVFDLEDSCPPATLVDLTLELMDSSTGVSGRLVYRRDLWKHASIDRMLGHYVTLLEGIVADADQRISKLPLLTPPERQQLLVQWNDTEAEYPKDKCLHDLFEERAARTPDAVAVVFEDQQLTYRELNARANQLAHRMRNLGVGPKELVGLCLERSPELVIAILAILKAGGAYLPLDPEYPPKRLGFMIEDGQPAIVITTAALANRLPATDRPRLCLDQLAAEVREESCDKPVDCHGSDDTAYVMYTSGSTGQPKGVRITHRAICNRLLWMQETYRLSPEDRVLQKTPFSFDVSVWEFFWPLLTGARLVMARPGGHRDARYLAELINHQQITTLHFVPSMLQVFLEEELSVRCRSIRRVICSGEVLPYDLLERFFATLDAELHNLYGPTEAAVDVTSWECRENDQRLVPIGKPVANTQCYILDRYGNPVPIGVPGELHVGGVQLARDYLNRPQLTTEKFIPDPFSTDPGARLYKTGDLCRWQPDGNIRFLGRLDQQVKTRGFRVELGEVESVLNEHEAVAQCAVELREGPRDEERLIAYWVPRSAMRRAPSLRDYLSSRLPDYMVPSAFVQLESLPRTPNGKVDCQALPAPDASRPDLESENVPPGTPIEQGIAEIWRETLGVEPVGIHDNFFALGGHSLLAAKVINCIHDTFGVRLSVANFFTTPTVADMARQVQAGTSPVDSPVWMMAPLNRHNDRAPLSFGQEQLWHFVQRYPDVPAYNETFTIRFHGSVDSGVVHDCLNEIARRHHVLRTAIVTESEGPVQVIVPDVTVDLKALDVRGEVEHTREPRLIQMVSEIAQRPFDLSRPPLMRAALAVVAEDDHRLYVVFHHIVIDGLSAYYVFLDELWELYEAFRAGKPSPLPDLEVQYPEYAAWQRQRLSPRVEDTHLKYWKMSLADVPQLALPTDRPRRSSPTYRGDQRCFQYSREFADALADLAVREDVTLYVVLLAAFKTLLCRYTGQDDVVVGTVSGGRERSDIEPLLGYFLNTFPVRTDISGNPTFRNLLTRVRQVVLQALDHDELPFVKLIEALPTSRGPSNHPLFQVMFVLEPSVPVHASGWDVSQMDIHPGTAKYDLSLEMEVRPEGIIGRFEYSTELFDAATVDRLVTHFHMLLGEVISDPDRPIWELPLLTERERNQLLVQWNDTAAEIPRDKCVHELFEAQTRQTPDAEAVAWRDESLTYRSLNRRANQLARRLRQLGVQPGTPVAMYLGRGPQFVISVLGILKAGAAYVPLALEYPVKRLQWMLEDSGATVLLAQTPLPTGLPVRGLTVLDLRSDAATIEACSSADLRLASSAEDVAYIMYTSGSTGRPKGVAVRHLGVVRLVCGQRYADFGANQRFLFHSSPSFDASTFELWGPLLHGGTCVIFPQKLLDFADLEQLVCNQKITCLWLTAGLFNQIIDQSPSVLDAVNHVLTGGEILSVSHITRALERFPNLRLTNGYGPTEGTTFTCTHLIRSGSEFPTGSVPIGRPLANTLVYVLDVQQRPAPIGIPGELYIGGAGLARGYWNRPELTAEKFVANPFTNDPDSQLYRTGDLCRWRADGNLEFLGRLDDQVKLRGFRIELGEIEARLNKHLSVAQSVVALRVDRVGNKRLVAYYVSETATVLSVSELRSHLRRQLPDYMVPATFVSLDMLPLTPNGKINRRALPAPDDSRPELECEYVAPSNPIEETLASTWCEVLGLDRVGIHDNFFALGGHSLLATTVNAKINSALRVSIPLRTLFEAQTIAELASKIETLPGSDRKVCNRELNRVDREHLGHLPLSFCQQRLWFLEQMEGELTAYHLPMAWRLRGTLQREALRRALEEVVRRHEALRTTFVMLDGEPQQVIGTIERFELPVEDLRSLQPEQQEKETVQRCRLEAERPFDLTNDLLLRASLLRLADDEHVLLLTMHHIASDGWSLYVLWRELKVLYDAYCRSADAYLPELPLQYADYAVWQRRELQGQRLEQLLHFWREQLAGVSTLELPTDRPRPSVPTYKGARVEFQLSGELIDQLKLLSLREGVTLHMTLLAAFQTMLARYSGQDDIAVGTPVAGRNHADLEDQIGFFVNTLVLRTDLSEDPTFRELLRRVRQVSLDAYDHQDLPFERLVEELQPERHLSRSPLVQVVFQLLSFSATDLVLRGLEVSRLPSSSQRVRFDLEMHLWQHPKYIRGMVVYSTELFDASTVERMLGHYMTLLEGIVADPDQRISELPLLTDAEREQLLVEWNETQTEYPRDKCLHDLFEEQVVRTPDAVAVVFEDQQLTYCELNGRADQLAHHMQNLGVGPEALVGLCLERSPELVVGILAILKAGGAYLPLDPDDPPQRLRFMLTDAKVSLVLTHQQMLQQLPETDCDTICLDAEQTLEQTSAQAKLRTEGCAHQLAYVMYTSGSTGVPKGVAVTHRAVARLVKNTDYVNLTSRDCIAHVANVAFDAATFEMWGALLCGGRLAIGSRDVALSTHAFAEFLRQQEVTTLFLTTSLFNHHVAACPDVFSPLKQVLFGGEAVDVPMVRKLLEHQPPTRLLHVYGPTENTTFTTWDLVEEVAPDAATVPIGRPIANTQVYVLDPRRNLVPIGVPGELYIGGEGLARGYLHRGKLTAERFVPNPFSHAPNARLYRTGDLCRWRAEGTLEFLGRADDQVKLRGFRIELGEIEATLNEHPNVSQSVVILREDRPGDKRLVAYYVSGHDKKLNSTELSDHLRRRLPNYMVPAAFVHLDTIPLTSSGKINRRLLKAPDDLCRELDTGYVAPRDSTEQQLASIWCDVLNLEQIGVHDDFFELGGHSLQAVRLFARIEQVFGRTLPLTSLFQHGTISHLAQSLTDQDGATDLSTVVPLSSDGEGRPLYLMPGMAGEVMFSIARAVMEKAAGRFPVLAVQPTLPVQDLEPFRDLRTTAECYVDALRAHQSHGPYALTGYSFGGMIAYEVACVLKELGEEVDVLAVIDTGPGSSGHPSQLGDGCRRLGRIMANLPFWLPVEFRRFSAGGLARRAARKLRRFYRLLASRGRAQMKFDDVFSVNPAPSQSRELSRAAFDAFHDFVPRAYPGRLILFRAKVRPLLRGCEHDLGWGRHVGHIEVHQFNGDHEMILRPPLLGELAKQLTQLLENRV